MSTTSSAGVGSSPPALWTAPDAASSQNVVPLFAELEGFDAHSDQLDPDWPGAIQLIRDVGAQVRRERHRAREIVQQSRSLIQRTVLQAESAERRAEAAEAQAYEACLRADRADASLRLAQERAQQAEERAQTAEASEREAQIWLRRLYACLKIEQELLSRDILNEEVLQSQA
ncbi:hypothetical protein [Methylobacterium iners]|uniref:hypothetical protein n=1 Tax=Methylobacterium iners TaxID=418707 RepID=UPI001EE39AB2|nr:hypothetical protein [Methylobacterium iners]